MTTVNSATSTNKATSGDAKLDRSRTALSTNFDDFLLMLTTQLKNQDPTQPMDPSQFTNQLVLFSQVEQQLATNEKLTKMIEAQSQGTLGASVDYIGKTVEATGNAGELVGDIAQFAYDLPQDANTVNVIVSDGAKRAVFSGNGTKVEGKNVVAWDGTNSFTGKKMPEGTYFITVVAKDGAGKEIKATTYTSGVVTGAEIVDGAATLTVAGTAIKLSDVKAVRQPLQVAQPEPEPEETASNNAANDNEETTETAAAS